MPRMTPSEAFVETLVAQGVTETLWARHSWMPWIFSRLPEYD